MPLRSLLNLIKPQVVKPKLTAAEISAIKFLRETKGRLLIKKVKPSAQTRRVREVWESRRKYAAMRVEHLAIYSPTKLRSVSGSGHKVQVEPGLLEITKEGAIPGLQALGRLGRRIRSGAKAGVQTFQKTKGVTPAQALQTARAAKKAPVKPRKGLTWGKAGLIAGGAAAGGAAIGATGFMQRHLEQQSRPTSYYPGPAGGPR